MTTRLCSVDGCNRLHLAKDLCRMHYLRVYRHESLMLDVPPRQWSDTGICSVTGCGDPVRAHGLCGPHDMRSQQYGDPLGGSPLMKDRPKICIVDTCVGPVLAFGYCNAHNKRIKAFGDPMADIPIRPVHAESSPAGHQWCPQCQMDLPFEDFASKINAPNGLNRWCQTCVWKKHIFHTYHITWQEYADMWMDQYGCCKTCHRPETMVDANSRIRRLCVDHDHTHCPGEKSCGQCVRGLLCNMCNRSLGMLNDDLDLLMAMANYIVHYRELLEMSDARSDIQVDGED